MQARDLTTLRANLPHKPGVYQYFNVHGDLLYVGKAKDLWKRVNSYWSKKGAHSPWTQLLVTEIADIKIIEVTNELEALLLENSLIKSLKPKYNIQLKDDKTFPFLRISQEAYPRFSIVRKVKNDRARYLGPYFSATYLRTMLKLLQALYGIKTVSDASYEARSSVPQEIGLGARNLNDPDTYKKNVEAAIKFVTSPHPTMERELQRAMEAAAHNQEFERAAIIRDRLAALKELRNEQSVASPQQIRRDYVGVVQQGKLIGVYILCEREGHVVKHYDYLFEIPTQIAPEDLTQYVIEYVYVNGLPLPTEIVLATLPTEATLLAQDLSNQSGKKVTFRVPQRGDSKQRLTLATDNAQGRIRQELLKKQRREQATHDLAKLLQLPQPPHWIEAFDISNLGATNIVGASVVFIDGQPAKQHYRKYAITTPEGQDDFASMRELVYRRLSNKQRALPDLLLIDGGKGQLTAACEAMQRAGQSLPIIALAKKEELIFRPGYEDPIALPHSSDALLLLTAIRNEVHRFVISFHRHRRGKQLFVAE